MSKQDRQGVRTPADIERKYDLGRDYSYLEETVANAQRTASIAKSAADNATNVVVSFDGRITKLEETGGVPGENGATFIPSVDADGNLSWTNDKGLENPAPVNIKGPKGDSGEAGAGSDIEILTVAEIRAICT